MAKGSLELTEKQELFVEAFLGECLFDPIKSYQAAGYSDTFQLYSSAQRVLKSEAVQHAIHARMKDMNTAWWINEEVVVQELWKEAHEKGRGASHAARINALVWIGKHLGMWQEKKEEEKDTRPNIQVINYGVPKEQLDKELSQPEVIAQKDKAELPEGVLLADYTDKGTKH